MSSGAPRPLAVTAALLDGELVGLRCEGGKIVALGAGVTPEPGDEMLDADGAILVAPFVNGHTHAAMTLFRGYGGDLPLMRWLREAIWPIEAKLGAEDVYWGTRLACLEMIRTGTARFWDMYWQPGASARAVRDAGLRATIGGPLFDAEGGTEEMKAGALESLDELRTLSARVEASLAPHAIYTVSEELLRWTAELSREREVPMQIHLSETEREVEECLSRHGVRPAAYLDRLGVLDQRTVLAHGVWLDREELELIAERGCVVVANPAANMKLAVGGFLPYPAARAAGVAVGLGTDGAGSNNSLDMFSDLKLFALSQRHAAGDAAVIPAKEAWEVATGARAPFLTSRKRQLQRVEPPVGIQNVAVDAGLWVGGTADFLLLRRDAYELAVGDLYADLVYAASGSVVDTMVVAGRVLMRGGLVEGAEEVVARAAERARGLGIG